MKRAGQVARSSSSSASSSAGAGYRPQWTWCGSAGVLGLLIALAATGCSVQKIAVSSMVPLMEASLTEAYASNDIETVREGIPGQIWLLRGVCQSDPGKVEPWTTAVQLYTSFAMIFIEAEDPARAVRLYDEGMELGLRFLMRRHWFQAAWEQGPDALREEILRRRPSDLAPIMMWTAACLGKHVLYNLDRPREVADLPYAHVLTDASIALAGDYFYGMPYAVKGVMLAATPPMLGGDLEEADRLFQRAFEISGHRFLFHQILYARHYCVASLREDLFDQALEEVLTAPEGLLPEARLINLLAREQARALRNKREDLF